MVARGQDPLQIRVESYGDHVPVTSNDSEEGRAKNRRVEFFYSRSDIVETLELWRSQLIPDRAE